MGKSATETTSVEGLRRVEASAAEQDMPVHQLPVATHLKARTTSQNASFVNRIKLRFRTIGKSIQTDVEDEIAFGHLFYWVPVLIGTGSVIWLTAKVEPTLTFMSVLFALGSLIVLYHRNIRQAGWCLGVSLCLVACGMFLAKIEASVNQTVLLDSPVSTQITGKIVERERMAKGQWRYVLTELSTAEPVVKRLPSKVTLVARMKDRPATSGEIISGLARLSPPSGPALIGLNDFGFDAYFSGNGAVGFFYGPPMIIPANPDPISIPNMIYGFDQAINNLRNSIGARIQSILPGDTGAFATSMVTDERRAISKETTEALRLSGLAHIVAISGLNMALASGIFFIGIRTLLSLSPRLAYRFNIKKIAAGGALAGLTAYFLISGSAVSAERAFIMMAIILIAVFVDRPSISLRNVSHAALIILITEPSAILSPSFQMSFAATAALVSGYHLIQKVPMPENPLSAFSLAGLIVPIARFFGAILFTSAIGGAATAIFSIEHFHRVAAYGLPANLVAMPVITFIVMPFGLIAMLLMPFGLDEIPLRVMGFGLDITIQVATYVASFGGNVTTGRLAPWFFPVACIGFIAMCLLRTRLRVAGVLIFLGALIAEPWMPSVGKPDFIVYEDPMLAVLVAGDRLNANIDKPPEFIFTQIQYGLNTTDFVGPTADETIPLKKRIAGEPRPPLAIEERQQFTERILRALGSSNGAFWCAAKQWCAVKIKNAANVVIVYDPILTGIACNVADIVIVATSLRFSTCKSGALLITRDTLRKRGTLEFKLPDNSIPLRARKDFIKSLEIAGAMDGVIRDWTKHRYYQWRTGSFDPPFDDDVNYSDE